jgi:hypothetical protein
MTGRRRSIGTPTLEKVIGWSTMIEENVSIPFQATCSACGHRREVGSERYTYRPVLPLPDVLSHELASPARHPPTGGKPYRLLAGHRSIHPGRGPRRPALVSTYTHGHAKPGRGDTQAGTTRAVRSHDARSALRSPFAWATNGWPMSWPETMWIAARRWKYCNVPGRREEDRRAPRTGVMLLELVVAALESLGTPFAVIGGQACVGIPGSRSTTNSHRRSPCVRAKRCVGQPRREGRQR